MASSFVYTRRDMASSFVPAAPSSFLRRVRDAAHYACEWVADALSFPSLPPWARGLVGGDCPRLVRGRGPCITPDGWADAVSEYTDPVRPEIRRAGTVILASTDWSLAEAWDDDTVVALEISLGHEDDPLEPLEASPLYAGLDPASQAEVADARDRLGDRLAATERGAVSFVTSPHLDLWTTRVARTHYDDYDGFLMVLQGAKTVYTAPPGAFAGSRERPQYAPLPSDPFECSGVFTRYELRAGDILYVPRGWWHYVVTPREVLMLTLWFR